MGRLLTLLVFVLWPLQSIVAAPPGVTGIRAESVDGQIHVKWNAPEGATDITLYKIYWGQKSILESGGVWDDAETTTGPVLEHVLQDPVQGDELFISVLAVNAAGEESPFFVEEAHIVVPTETVEPVIESAPLPIENTLFSETQSEQTIVSDDINFIPPLKLEPVSVEAVTPVPVAESPSESFDVLLVKAVSSTGVLVLFSLPLSMIEKDAPRAFSVLDASGTVLSLVRLRAEGKEVLVVTEMQTPGKPYAMLISQVVRGQGATSLLSIDPLQSTFFFQGFGGSGSEEILPTDISNLKLQYVRTANTYTVTAAWVSSKARGLVASYEVHQSFDEGKTFDEGQPIEPTVQTVRFTGVTPGPFGVLVRAVSVSGRRTKGTFATITLPPIAPAKKPLTKSGMGVGVLLAAAIGSAAYRALRRSR